MLAIPAAAFRVTGALSAGSFSGCLLVDSPVPWYSLGMTNNESPYTPTVTDSGSLSHKTCSHDKTARERHNCRYESAKARMAQPKPSISHLLRAATENIVISNMN